MELNFCTQCGNPLVLKTIGDEGAQKYCRSCERFFFDNPPCVVLTAIINEKNQVLLLKQNYISSRKYTLCSGYVKKGETLEQAVAREVLEETGQKVLSCEYITSYYYQPKSIIMAGFAAYIKSDTLRGSLEVDELVWADLNRAVNMVERENNFSGIHLDNVTEHLKGPCIQ